MSGFLDHLFDPAASGKKGRERMRYRETLRTLIQDAPAVRRLPVQDFPFLVTAVPATEHNLPTADLFYFLVGETAQADHFREWKRRESARPVYRLDPVWTEEQVLETRSMGADAFTLDVCGHDLPMLQFLLEVGRDYGLPAILSCRSPEDLALALKVQDGGLIWLRDELCSEALFDLPVLRERTILIESLEPLSLASTTVCGVIRLTSEIPLPPKREPPEPKAGAHENDADEDDDLTPVSEDER